jgi:hypothetical protein
MATVCKLSLRKLQAFKYEGLSNNHVHNMKIKEYSELFFRDSSKHEGIEPDISNIWLNAITALFSTF